VVYFVVNVTRIQCKFILIVIQIMPICRHKPCLLLRTKIFSFTILRDYDEETYEHLSSRRRQELDNLRSIAILRYLSRFTLTLKRENMMKRLPDTDLAEEENSSDVSSDGNSSGDEGEQNDIEMGDKALQTETAGDDVEYTHVLIPHPSYDTDGVHVKELEEYDSEKKSIHNITHRLFFRKSKEKEEDNEGKEESDEDKVETDDEDDLKEMDAKMTEKRAVPIFCAVCLMEYSISERVCYSSNSECTHVFHEDCILQWLISLGRKRSKRQSFARNPSVKKLLDYDLACPCCRQDFLSKNLIFAPDVEENA